jgi:C4-dicarboxylate transporter DctQ subunit
MSRPLWLQRLDQALSLIESWLIGGLVSLAFVIGSAQVILRYVFNTGVDWSEGVFVVFTVAAMLAAGSRAARDDAHVRMDLVAQHAPPAVRKALVLAAHLATLALCLYFCVAGYTYVGFAYEMETVAPETGIAEWKTWMVIPVSMLAFSVRYAILISDVWCDRPTAYKEVRE